MRPKALQRYLRMIANKHGLVGAFQDAELYGVMPMLLAACFCTGQHEQAGIDASGHFHGARYRLVGLTPAGEEMLELLDRAIPDEV